MSPRMEINKKLLPIKGHYFLFNAGTAPLVPYLSTYARQLGFSSATVGLIYTILPICGLIAKPVFGVIADRFKIQKFLFILFQIVTIVSFLSIYFIPENKSNVSVELNCNRGVTVLRSCYPSTDAVDQCKVTKLSYESGNILCDMNCDMTSPKMWQTVCKQWDIPQYCASSTDNIQYTTNVISVAEQNNKCAYIATSNVTLDGLTYVPHCHIGTGYVDVNGPCSLNCTNEKLSSFIRSEKVNMTCVDEMLNYRLCEVNITQLIDLVQNSQISECKASCDVSTPWKLMEICEGWQADKTSSCRPRTQTGELFPSNLSFVGTIVPATTISEHECVYIELKQIKLPDGSSRYPNCSDATQYQMESELFSTSCEISCNSTLLSEIFEETMEDSSAETDYTLQFGLFFLAMSVSWIGQAVVVTFADAICFNLLGDKVSHYGKQRMWGSVGWGIFSLLTGTLIDVFSDGAYKDYTIAFILMFVFMTGDVIVSCFIKNETTKMSVSILADVGSLLSSLPTFIFMLWTIVVGLCTGLLWNFLFWHIQDIANLTCDGADYTTTIQGLVSAIQTFGGEIPFLFVSGYILRKVGHVNMMSIVLFAFGVRYILYSFVTNPWLILPIELFQGITFGMFYPTMTSYANVVSPPGTETTVQGLVGAIFEGVGTSLGSFIGGRLFETYGGWNTFRWFGIGSLIFCVLHIVVQYFIKDKVGHLGLKQGYSSVIRYEQPNDKIYLHDK